MIKTWKRGLEQVFSKNGYLLLLAILLVILVPAYLALTNVLLLNPLGVNPSAEAGGTALSALLGVLAALGLTVAVFQVREMGALTTGAKTGFGGSIIGLFGSACPICQPVWLFWFGLGSAGAFLSDYGIYLLMASVLIVLFSLHLGLQSVAHGCPCRVKKR